MPRKRLSQEERRTQIIEVAMDLFARKGFKGATTRAIAEAAGVSEAIIFRHFATKEDLYDAIIEHTIERRKNLWEQDESQVEAEGDLETLLRGFARAFVARNRQDPTFIRLMMYSALEDHKLRERFLDMHRSPRIRAIREEIESGVQSGVYAQVDPRLTTISFLWTLMQYSINRFVATTRPGDPEGDEEMIENLIRVFTNGLRETAPPPGRPVSQK